MPFRQALTRVLRLKDVWIYGLISLSLWGATISLNGYLPLYLRNIGWTTVGADGAITPVRTTSWVAGIEQKVSPGMSLAGYYSGVSTETAYSLGGSSYGEYGMSGSGGAFAEAMKAAQAADVVEALQAVGLGLYGQFSIGLPGSGTPAGST